MTGNKFYFSSADKTIRVHAVEWLPVGEPKAVLQIFAGHAEQILRYEELAEYFISHGFAVIRSEHFAQEEVQFCVKSIKKKYPDIPCLLLGICQGVPVVNEFALNHPEAVEGVVLADAEQELHPISKELPVLRISGIIKNTREALKQICCWTEERLDEMLYRAATKQ